MSTTQTDREQMALSAELASVVVHDCANFLYNLRLQLELNDATKSIDANGLGWERLKAVADRLTNRIHEWHQWRSGFLRNTEEVDLNDLFRSIANDWPLDVGGPSFALQLAEEQARLTSRAGDVRILCLLLLLLACPAGSSRSQVSVQSTPGNGPVGLRISGVERQRVGCFDEDTKGGAREQVPSLLAAACQALANRLDAVIRVEGLSGPLVDLCVEFPRRLA